MKKWFRKSMLTGLVVVAFSAMALGSSSSGSTTTTSEEITDTPESERENLAIGDSVTLKGVTVTVNSVTETETNTGSPAYEVSITYANNSSKMITANPYDWTTVLHSGSDKAYVGGEVSFSLENIKKGEEWSGIVTLWKDETSEKIKFESSSLNLGEDTTLFATWLLPESNSAEDNGEAKDGVIVVNIGEMGEYGQEVTFNANTDMPETKVVYYLPVGKYSVSNTSSNAIQIGVQSEEVQITDEGWEEPKEVYSTLLLKEGETGEVEVVENAYLEINGNGTLEFTLK